MKRIAVLSPCLHNEHYGGVQCAGRLAVEGLNSSRSVGEIRVLCYGPGCTRKIRTASQMCSHSKAGAVLRALSLRGGPDSLLFWHLDLLKLLPVIGAAGKRVFLFLHGIECWRAMGETMRRLLNHVDVFLTNSDFTWERFVAMNPGYRAAAHQTVSLGIGIAEKRMEAPGDTPSAVIIARMYKSEGYKGHAELIKAWPMVLERIPGAELLVVGGGDGMSALQDLAATVGVGEQIRFHGLVSEGEKEKLIQRSRCLLLPSQGEGFGLVYLEAMRIGRPCLSSIHDAGREVIDPPRAGIAVDPADTHALAMAIAELLTPGATWEQRSANARKIYEETFTAAHFQRRLVDVMLGAA